MERIPLRAFLSRPRPAGAILLVLLAALQFFADTPVQSWLRDALFDTYQRLSPRVRVSAPAVVVAIDEKSLAHHGQWPWPRTLMAELLTATGSYRPLAIGIDIMFSEPDRLSPEQLAERHPHLGRELAGALKDLPSNDDVLAAAIRKLPAVLGVAGIDVAGTSAPPRSGAIILLHGDPLPYLHQYPGALRSIDVIDRAATSRGVISADTIDGVARRVPLVAMLAGAHVPALSIETLRIAAGADGVTIRAGTGGIESVALADVVVPVQPDGQLWVRFGPHDPERFVSAADVLARRVDPARLENKVAFVGITGLGLLDQHVTPLGERMPGIEIHAQIVENIFDRNLLARPHWAHWTESALFVLLGIIQLAAVPAWGPLRASLLLAAQVAALIAVGAALFKYAGVLFDAALPTIGLNVLFGGLLRATLSETEHHRQRLNLELEAQREAAARMAGELEAARRVQLGMLPVAARVFPGEARFELHALMTPTREVGGDLYDFFMIGRSHLLFMVGDVSGKGLAASIFMALSKALYKSAALRSHGDLARAMTTANAEISRDNPELMFVTVLACVLDLDSGTLAWCNAGHEMPYVLGARTPGVKALVGESGPPLCVIDDYGYKTNRYVLAPTDMLMLVSDGVTEAMDRDNTLFGHDRLETLLAALQRENSVEQAVTAVYEEVQRFSASAEMADDVTILGVRWAGPAPA
jgi:adenylate cyclase